MTVRQSLSALILLLALNAWSCENIGRNAWQHLTQLTSPDWAGRGPDQPGHLLAQSYIFNTLNLLYSTSVSRQEFYFSSGFSEKAGINWVAERTGTDPKLGYIAITAHYDHLKSKGNKHYPGADDNASGVAAILALAACFDLHQPRHNMLIIATDREEQGLYGAKSFLKDNPKLVKQIRLNINLDMVAHGNANKHYWVTGKQPSDSIVAIIHETNKKVIVPFKYGRKLRGEGRELRRGKIDLHRASDHYEFYKAGIPYVFITGENHRHYHQTHDSVDTINQPFYQTGIASIASLIQEIDKTL
ncbi:M20/M25/M40 family metallo-hydrolase [Thalassotalea mangrovi]|uniref:M28 family peptidase n=1 Tax=Thalassotalea mangrovi TaxID=2572245 RepID=A0A4U1B4E7_9GAMM|nr:M20/M25/M40 family metallo-hydrolase [Thalassotalea mangrovi]TKB44914.1 M28 family peptidase [Thalassotalea mangrovi]